MLKRNLYSIVFIGWMVFITWSSLFSFKEGDLPRFEIQHLDKAVHFTFYFVAAVLGVFAIREYSQGMANYRKSLLYIFVGLLVFGIIIEVIQYRFTLDRAGDIFDGLANGIGALCGVLATIFLFSKKRRLNWKQ